MAAGGKRHKNFTASLDFKFRFIITCFDFPTDIREIYVMWKNQTRKSAFENQMVEYQISGRQLFSIAKRFSAFFTPLRSNIYRVKQTTTLAE